MKILIFSQHFWPESFRINSVAQALSAAGHEIDVLTGQPNYPLGQTFDGYRAAASGVENFGAVTVHRVPLIPRGRGSAIRLFGNYLSFIVSAVVVGTWRLRGRRFDVVFVYASSPLLQAMAAVVLARVKRAPLVVWVQDLWPQSLQSTGYVKNEMMLKAVTAVVSWIYARSDLLLIQSKAFEAPVHALAPPATPIRYHPNPGEPELPPHHSGGNEAYALPAGFSIVFAGNMGTVQALDTVLSAAEQTRDLSDLQWILIGSGQRSEWLAEQVRARNLTHVHLPGRFPAEAMPAILAQASALLVSLVPEPSLALTVPSKVQTYLAAGKPIVASLDGEGARVVEEATAGLTAPAGDAPALAAAIRALHAMPQAVRDQMGANGRRFYAENFAPERLTAALIDHFSSVIAARTR